MVLAVALFEGWISAKFRVFLPADIRFRLTSIHLLRKTRRPRNDPRCPYTNVILPKMSGTSRAWKKNNLAGPVWRKIKFCFSEWRILVYFLFFSEDRPPNVAEPEENFLPFPTPVNGSQQPKMSVHPSCYTILQTSPSRLQSGVKNFRTSGSAGKKLGTGQRKFFNNLLLYHDVSCNITLATIYKKNWHTK